MYRPTHPHSNLLLDHLVQYVPYRIVSCASCKMCAVHLGNATRSKLVCLCDRLSAAFECDLPSVESGILKIILPHALRPAPFDRNAGRVPLYFIRNHWATLPNTGDLFCHEHVFILIFILRGADLKSSCEPWPHTMEQTCPRCRTSSFQNPQLKLMVNVWGHRL